MDLHIKHFLIVLAVITLACCRSAPAPEGGDAVSGASPAGDSSIQTSTNLEAVNTGKRVLIVFFSQGANTKRVAEELQFLLGGYGHIRGFIDGGMRSGIPDNETRASTVTLYLDVGAFARALGIESTRTITVLLVKSSGEILARASGPFSTAAAASLVSALKAMH